MLQVVRLRSFPLEPKALTFSHQQLALKHLSLCSSCAPGGKEEWKPPITKLAYASLLSDLIFLTQILPLAKKTFALFFFFFQTALAMLLKTAFESRGCGCTAGILFNCIALISWIINGWTESCLHRRSGNPGLIAKARAELRIATVHINSSFSLSGQLFWR